MKKFVFTCNMEKLILSDFDMILMRGEEIELTEAQISSSVDLQTALRHGGLVMRKKELVKAPVKSSRIRPKTKRVRRVKKVKTPDLEERLRTVIADTLEQKLSQVLKAVENQPAPAPIHTTAPPVIDTEAMLAAVREALAGVQTVVHTHQSTTSQGNIPIDDTPMFIPTGIVSGELAADIDTEQESSKGSSVDAATEALRQLRKAKKNKES